MGKGVLARNSFVAGLLSPRLEARTDLRQYSQGARQLVNMITRPHGGAFKRCGTVYMGQAKFVDRPARLIPFEVSTEQAYLLELGHYYMRFWTVNGQVLNGSAPLEIETPWADTDLDLIQKTQDADVAYLVHPNFLPHKLRRTDLAAFDLAPVSFRNGRAPVRPFNGDVDNKVTLTGTWPNLTATFAKASLEPGSDVGRTLYVRDFKNKRGVYATITGVGSPVTASLRGEHRVPDNALPAATDRWALGAFSDTEGCRAVAFHEGRLWYGGFKTQPDYLVASVSGDFDNFEVEDPTIDTGAASNDDKAITRRAVSGGQVSTILWMRSAAETLIVGTAGAEFVVRSAQAILTPTDTVVKAATTRGSAPSAPTGVDSQLFFIQQGGFTLRQLAYALESDGFQSADVSVLAEHLTRRGLAEVCYQQDPASVLWVRRRDGSLVGWTVERSQDVTGAHEHELGGIYLDGAPQVASIAVLPGASAAPEPVLLQGLPEPRTLSDGLGFEENPLHADWTATSGTFATAATATGLSAPAQGARFLSATNGASLNQLAAQRSWLLSGFSGWSQALVDAGRSEVDLYAAMAWAASPTASGSVARVEVLALDNAGTTLGVVAAVERPASESATDAWSWKSSLRKRIPPGTVRLRVRCLVTASAGHAAVAAGFDDVQVVIRQRAMLSGKGREQTEDGLWLVVRRTVNGQSRVYIERVAPSFAPELGPASTDAERRAAVEDAVFLDCALTFQDRLPVALVSQGTPAQWQTQGAHGLAVGDRVMLRGCKWRTPARDLDAVLHNHAPYRVAEVLNPTTVTLADLDGNPVGVPADRTPVASADRYLYREVTTVAGLDHLEGEPVVALANGRAVPGLVVTAGAVALPFPASVVTVGLPYTARVETTRFFGAGGRAGTDEAAEARVANIKLRLLDTLGGAVGVGPDPRRVEPILYGGGSDPLDRPFALVSGDVTVRPPASWSDPPTVLFVHAEPYPAEVLAAYATLDSNP